MAYNEKPQIKLYAYNGSTFELQAIIDDYMECSFERNLYQAGTFTISINYNIPNAQLFGRGLFVQFGSDPYDFGEITRVTDAIGGDGKASQIRTVTGYDARYILKRRVIKNMNANGTWQMTGKGETCLRNLVKYQCGTGAEEKRRLPISNTIPATENAIGKTYSVSESFSNLYEVCKTIATQSEIGWRMAFDGQSLTLECYEGTDRSDTVQFSTSFDSLADGNFTDSAESFSNAIYVGGKGQNDDRDIYEGETGSPAGLDRFECWDNQSSMTTEDEYAAEARSMLTQYGQTIDVSGNGLAKSPYVYKKQYDVGDSITLAFSGKSAVVQILSVTERWAFGAYTINFSFGKPQNSLSDQLQLMLRKIQEASNKTSSTDSVRWYTIPTDTAMPKEDVTYSTIGFVGTVSTGATFTLYLDDENTGSKTYHVYFKQLAGTGKLTLTTGKAGASDLVMNAGTYVAIIYVDGNGNVTSQGSTAVNAVQSGNLQPVTSDAVYNAISGFGAVTGVKGDAESTYRTGNVNLTPANIGAATSTDITNAISRLSNTYSLRNPGGTTKYLTLNYETLGNFFVTIESSYSIQILTGDSGTENIQMKFIPKKDVWNRTWGLTGYAIDTTERKIFLRVGNYSDLIITVGARCTIGEITTVNPTALNYISPAGPAYVTATYTEATYQHIVSYNDIIVNVTANTVQVLSDIIVTGTVPTSGGYIPQVLSNAQTNATHTNIYFDTQWKIYASVSQRVSIRFYKII